MNRRSLLCLLVALTLLGFIGTIVEHLAGWIDAHHVGLAQLFAVAVVLFLLFGAFVIDRLGRASRARSANHPSPALGLRSGPRAGGLGRASIDRHSRGRARGLSGNARRRPPTLTGPWREQDAR